MFPSALSATPSPSRLPFRCVPGPGSIHENGKYDAPAGKVPRTYPAPGNNEQYREGTKPRNLAILY